MSVKHRMEVLTVNFQDYYEFSIFPSPWYFSKGAETLLDHYRTRTFSESRVLCPTNVCCICTITFGRHASRHHDHMNTFVMYIALATSNKKWFIILDWWCHLILMKKTISPQLWPLSSDSFLRTFLFFGYNVSSQLLRREAISP